MPPTKPKKPKKPKKKDMATETLRPAVAETLSLSNLSGTYADIDDDPDAPDGNWLTASGNNVNVSARTTLATPTGNPTVGADLQEFRVQVRQFDVAQGGTPDARIELWENGSLVRAGSDIPVTGSGQVIAFTWNANELGTADGSLVEIMLVGTKSGGSPGNRNTVEVGAMEWNVVYDAGATTYQETVAATSTMTPAVTDVMTALRTLAATSTMSPVIAKLATYYRTIAASSAMTAVVGKVATFYRTLAATSSMTAAVARRMYQTVAATSTMVADLTKGLVQGITIAATSTMTAAITDVFTAVRSLNVSSTMTSVLAKAATFYRTVAASTTLTSAVQKTVSKYLSVSSTATPGLSKPATFARSLAATTVVTPAVAAAYVTSRTLAAVSTAVAGLSRVVTYSGGAIAKMWKALISYYH